MAQPVPSVTDADVARIIRREFAASDLTAAEGIVLEYGRGREAARVRLAALKLARGHLQALRRHIEDANRDYRDVLSAAEYPHASGLGFVAFNALPPDQRQAIYDADWNQYREWLERK